MTKPTGNPRGRPPIPPEAVRVPVSIRLRPHEAALLRHLGRDWLAEQLEQAYKPELLCTPSSTTTS